MVGPQTESCRKFYIESYGCQMNVSDSEIVASILVDAGFAVTPDAEKADLVLINTCSIREKAEQTIRKRLTEFRKSKENRPGLLIGVLGCMAERLKSRLLDEEKLVDIVIGPDAYRSLPLLVAEASTGQQAVNVLLSREETYGDISPVRLNTQGISAFISIMRGCDNMCSFCVVPFTRGRERSRDPQTIVREGEELFGLGYREVVLLGQNVDSYHWFDEGCEEPLRFAGLLDRVAAIDPLLRVRFSTSHPKDITDEVLFTMAARENICKHIHLPLQSGSTRILQLMNRGYTREWYRHKVDRIRELLPGCSISTDIISGFCSETEEDHQDTLQMMELCNFDLAYMFMYSERPGTMAAKRYPDDVPLEVKKNRLAEIVSQHRMQALENSKKEIGLNFRVLVEGPSRRSNSDHCGRTDHNKMVVFPRKDSSPGDYVRVGINQCTAATLMGTILDDHLVETLFTD